MSQPKNAEQAYFVAQESSLNNSPHAATSDAAAPDAANQAEQVLTATYLPTVHTESPWGGGGFQHGSPPAALVAVNLEAAAKEFGLDMVHGRFSRMTVELLGPVPLSELTCTSRLLRGGKRISYIETVITDADGREFIRGTGWWIKSDSTVDLVRHVAENIPGPEHGVRAEQFTEFWRSGYIDSIDVVQIDRPEQAIKHHWDFDSPIHHVYWSRSNLPVVLGEEDSPWVRLMKTVDISNGLNQILDPREWTWMNVDMTVYLHAVPYGEWVGHVSEANYGPDGVGTTVTRIYDERGPVGTVNQGLLLARVREPRG
ncbi:MULTISPECIES: thioesterase family protein [Corynebacterium]|uniref:thioesterase family protein n=1 Tax=Corynebacterium TaxID=1716 RepID=UPI001CE3C965|nr:MULTISPECIES: thioesterase family protein [Corynebacterium]